MSNNILRYNSEKSLGKNTKKYIKYLFMEKPHFCLPQDTMWLSTTHFLNTKSIQRNTYTHTHGQEGGRQVRKHQSETGMEKLKFST